MRMSFALIKNKIEFFCSWQSLKSAEKIERKERPFRIYRTRTQWWAKKINGADKAITQAHTNRHVCYKVYLNVSCGEFRLPITRIGTLGPLLQSASLSIGNMDRIVIFLRKIDITLTWSMVLCTVYCIVYRCSGLPFIFSSSLIKW